MRSRRQPDQATVTQKETEKMISHSTLGRRTATTGDHDETRHLVEWDARDGENNTRGRSCGEGRFYQEPPHGRHDEGSQSGILNHDEYRLSFGPRTGAAEGFDRPCPEVNEPTAELNLIGCRERPGS